MSFILYPNRTSGCCFSSDVISSPSSKSMSYDRSDIAICWILWGPRWLHHFICSTSTSQVLTPFQRLHKHKPYRCVISSTCTVPTCDRKLKCSTLQFCSSTMGWCQSHTGFPSFPSDFMGPYTFDGKLPGRSSPVITLICTPSFHAAHSWIWSQLTEGVIHIIYSRILLTIWSMFPHPRKKHAINYILHAFQASHVRVENKKFL